MLYYMSSKVFNKLFLNHESDKDILNCQYVLVSYRIRAGGGRNNVVAYNGFYPVSEVLMMDKDSDRCKKAYYEQLDGLKNIIAILIKGSIEKKFNIIFMCSAKEYKMGYMQLIAEYIYDKFGYPVYNYSDYVNCKCELIDFDKDKILKKCNKLIKKDKIKSMSDEQLEHMIKKHPHKIEKLLKKHYNYELDLSDIDYEEELYYAITQIREFLLHDYIKDRGYE